jgi:hypothetical protein
MSLAGPGQESEQSEGEVDYLGRSQTRTERIKKGDEGS